MPRHYNTMGLVGVAFTPYLDGRGKDTICLRTRGIILLEATASGVLDPKMQGAEVLCHPGS